MSNIPADLSYTAEHEWIAGPAADGAVRIGITDHAQGELGDVVFVQLPEVGESVEAGAAVGEIESTKSVSDIFAPVSGEVTAVATPLSRGRSIATYDITITDDDGRRVCTARLTCALRDRPPTS